MNRAVGLMVFTLIMLMGIFLLVQASQSMEIAHSDVKRLVTVERERSKEYLSVTWEEEGIRIKNTGSKDTVVRYIYYYFGSEVPKTYAKLDIPLKVGEEVLIRYNELGFDVGPDDYLSFIPTSPNGNKYYLCYDGFTPSHPGLGDYEKQCMRLMASDFPEHDRLDWGIVGLAWYRSTESQQQIVTQPEYRSGARVWSACVWLKLESVPNQNFLILEVKPAGDFPTMYFKYSKAKNKIYLRVDSKNLGLSTSNPSNPLSWGHYCSVLEALPGGGFEAKFYFNGTLVSSKSVSGSGGYTEHVQLKLPGHPPVGHWIDQLFVTNRTLTPSEISVLYRGGDPLLWGFMYSFDYLRELPYVEVVTDLGLKYAAFKPNIVSKGVTPEGIPPEGG